MYSYHAHLIWQINIALFITLIALSIITILFIISREYLLRKRARALLNIKRNVYELTLSGQELNNKVCMPFVEDITPQQFLAVTTNRNREAIFFNEAEQKVFKNCFMSPEKIGAIEKMATRTRNKWQCIRAILSLGYGEVGSALEIFKKSINDKDEDIAYFSIIALGQLKNISSARILLDFLKKHRFYRYKVISVLENFSPAIADEAIKLITDPDPSVRLWALRLLSKLKASQYYKEIEGKTGDESEEVRAAACECLGELGRKGSKTALVKCLEDNDWLVRVHAVKALSKILGKDCLPEIINRINDPSLSVIDSVKDAMTEHIEASIPYIEYIFEGNDGVAKRVALEALEVSGYLVKLLKDILLWADEDKNRAVRLLESMIRTRPNFGLEAALDNFEESQRKKLLEIIKTIDSSLGEQIEKKLSHQADET